jgi:hypothetical protein
MMTVAEAGTEEPFVEAGETDEREVGDGAATPADAERAEEDMGTLKVEIQRMGQRWEGQRDRP